VTLSLQEQFAPHSICYGCGPANERGLHVRSLVDGEAVVADWTPAPYHEAFPGMLNGGVIGTLLDCHANWTAAVQIMGDRGLDHPPGCVTAEYAVRLRRPTPVDRPLELRAWPIERSGDRVVVDAEIVVDGIITATCRGTFVAVGPDHPAYERW
jgi:acyl-coenzyme A thioesterase PaaI-like protein